MIMTAQLSISAFGAAGSFTPDPADITNAACLAFWFRAWLGFVLGACLGSFANATAMRLGNGAANLTMASTCSGCHRRLSAVDLIPVYGWVRYGGLCKCRSIRLHWRYIFAELALGALVAIYAVLLPDMTAIGFAIAAIFMMISAMTDLETLTLHPPLLVMFALIGGSLCLAGDAGLISWHLSSLDALIGLAVGAATPFLINAIYRLVRGRNGFGTGDVWLLGAIGVWAGWGLCLAIFLSAALIGAIIGGLMMIANSGNGQTKLPFGSLLAGVFMLSPFLLNGLVH